MTGSLDVTDGKTKEVIILGAGLAGLGAGYALSSSNSSYGADILVIEAGKAVGGLAKTVNHQGFKFDLGGHRFKTSNKKTEPVNQAGAAGRTACCWALQQDSVGNRALFVFVAIMASSAEPFKKERETLSLTGTDV